MWSTRRLGNSGQTLQRKERGRISSVIEWTTNDYQAVVDLAGRISDYVEANKPDTLAFEWFGDENTGKVVWYQIYVNDEAFLRHAQNMNEAGFANEVGQLLTQDRVLLLMAPTLPETEQMAEQIGAEVLERIAGVVR